LARLVQGGRGGEVRLKLYLTITLMATKRPYDLQRPPSPQRWAALLALTGHSTSRRVSSNLRWLHLNKFIELTPRAGRLPLITLIDPIAGTGPYVRPIEQSLRYIGLPLGLWSEGWILELSPTALALLMIIRDVQEGRSEARYASQQDRDAYHLSSDTWTRASRELVQHELLDIRRVPQGGEFDYQRMRNLYSVNTDRLMSPPKLVTDQPLCPVAPWATQASVSGRARRCAGGGRDGGLGRTRRVSRPVLDALADALRLAADERGYLFALADVAPAVPTRPRPGGQQVDRRLWQLLDGMPDIPAMVLNRRMDVLAWNRAAVALLTDFGALPPGERNLIRLTFLDAAYRSRYADWQRSARECVALLRMEAGRNPDDVALTALVGELSVKDQDFRAWWGSHQVRGPRQLAKTYRHPVVGELALDVQQLSVDTQPDQQLVAYTATPGSAAQEALRFLLQWSAHSTVHNDARAVDGTA